MKKVGITVDVELPPHDHLKMRYMKGQIEKEKQKEKYNADVLSTLRKIESNTNILIDIASLLRVNNQKQDEIFSLFIESVSIAKAQTKEEADGLYKVIMKKITSTVNDVDSVIKLTNICRVMYETVQQGLLK